jgi:hypothetical protein
VYTAGDMATKTKPKGKLKQAKRSGATQKRSKGQSISKQSNRRLTHTKKISRRPGKSTRSKAVSRKELITVGESTPSSLGSTTGGESQEVTAFGSHKEGDEKGAITP